MAFRPHRQTAPERPWRRRAPRRKGRNRDWLDGTLVELDATNGMITIRVESGGHPIPARGTEVALDVREAHIHAADGDGDGRASLTDLFPGDQLHVELHDGSGKAASARRVVQQSEGGVPGGLRRLWPDAV